jgi:cytochrome c oxidase subunit 2
MHKWAMFILFIAASVLGLSVIIFAPPEGHVEEVIPEAQENEIQLIMTNYQFDQPEYRMTAGETMTLTMVNKQGVHGVMIQGTDINLTPDNASQEVTFDEPGEYVMICSIMCGPGHADMVAKLIVEAPGGDSGASDSDSESDSASDSEEASAA